MDSDRTQQLEAHDILSEYFPRDAVQVLEDVRVARNQLVHATVTDPSHLLASLTAGMKRS
jgi:hypothetical protein